LKTTIKIRYSELKLYKHRLIEPIQFDFSAQPAYI